MESQRKLRRGEAPGTRRRWPAAVAAWALVASSLGLLVADAPTASAAGIRSVATADSGGLNTLLLSVATPAGTVEGDLLVAQITAGGGTGNSFVAPAGWDLVRRDDEGTKIGQAVYVRPASATDALDLPIHTWLFSGNKPAAGAIIAVQGIDTSDPVDAHAGQPNSLSTAVTAPGVTTTVANTMLLGFFATDKSTTFTPPATMAETYETGGGIGGTVTASAASQIMASAGPTGDRIATTVHEGFNVGALLALKGPSVSLDAASGSVDEAEGDVLIPVSLSVPVNQDVSVAYTVTGGTAEAGKDFILAAGIATIVAGDLGTNITVSVIDDAIDEGNETVQITINDPSDASLGTITAFTLTIVDDDVAGLSVDDVGAVEVSEWGGTDSLNVSLLTEPLVDVVLSVASSDAGEAVVDPSQLTFGPTNWSVPQQVTVTGVDDDVDDGDQIVQVTVAVLEALGSDGYDAVPDALVAVTVLDDDIAGVIIAESDGTTRVPEAGGIDTMEVALAAEPLGDVVLGITSGDTTEATVVRDALTFGPVNWSVAQTITVTGIDDDIDDGDQTVEVTISILELLSSDEFDDLVDAAVSVTVLDDDTAALLVAETDGNTSVSETGTTDAIDVVLATQPLADVALSVTADDATEATVDRDALTFGPGNWGVAQTIIVTGVDDDIDDGDQGVEVTISILDLMSSDEYDDLVDAAIAVTVLDDDTAALLVTESDGTTSVSETGTTDVIDVVLATEPAGDVVLGITSDDATEAAVDRDALTFGQGNWSVAQTITVTGVDDDIDDGDQAVEIQIGILDLVSSDEFDDLLDVAVAVTVLDDDVAGVSINETDSGTAVAEDGSQDSFDVVLTAAPVTDVILTITSNDTTEVAVLNTTLTFGSGNWSQSQTVTLAGVDDADVDGDQHVNVTVAVNVTASDAAFVAVTVQNVTVTNADDDSAGGGGSGGGAGGGGSGGGGSSLPTVVFADDADGWDLEEGSLEPAIVQLKLDRAPWYDVVLTPAADDARIVFDPSRLVFSPQDWDEQQNLSIYARDDFDSHDEFTTVTIRLVDTGDHGVDELEITIRIHDDDRDGVYEYSGIVDPDLPVAQYPVIVPAAATGPTGGLWHLDRTGNDSHGMRLTITYLDEPPEGVPPPPSGTPLAWMWDIRYESYDPTDDSIRLVFRVPTAWLEEHCPGPPCEPRIYQYHDGTWHALAPAVIGHEGDDTLFEIYVDQFSPFAFGGATASPGVPDTGGQPPGSSALVIFRFPALGVALAALAAIFALAALVAIPPLAVRRRTSKAHRPTGPAVMPDPNAGQRVRTLRHSQDAGPAPGGQVRRFRSSVQSLKENGRFGRP